MAASMQSRTTGLAMILGAALCVAGCSERGDESGDIAQADPAPETTEITPGQAGVEQAEATPDPEPRLEPDPEPARTQVVLYSSADDFLAREVVQAFEAAHPIDVRFAGDTEATKTVGLVQRLRSERQRPRADVWWSSEPFYTIKLAEEGVLAGTEFEESGTWPERYIGADGAWYGFATRARAIVYDTRKLDESSVPTTLRAMAEPEWRGRVGMAKPIAGTTIGHLASMVALWGEPPTRDLMRALKENRIRLYDGNASVVRAVAMGEIDVGLTDTDDVWAGQRNGWPVGIAYEASEFDGELLEDSVPGLMGFGPLVMPNTVARVAGGPNGAEAELLINALLSAENERRIMETDSRNVPVRPDLSAELASAHPETVVPNPAEPDLQLVADHIDEARRIAADVFGY